MTFGILIRSETCHPHQRFPLRTTQGSSSWFTPSTDLHSWTIVNRLGFRRICPSKENGQLSISVDLVQVETIGRVPLDVSAVIWHSGRVKPMNEKSDDKEPVNGCLYPSRFRSKKCYLLRRTFRSFNNGHLCSARRAFTHFRPKQAMRSALIGQGHCFCCSNCCCGRWRRNQQTDSFSFPNSCGLAQSS
jgi:hypothetical protein